MKSTIFRLILVFGVLTVLAGCSKEEAASPVITIEQTVYEVSAESNLYTVSYKIDNVAAGELPEAVSEEDWVTGVEVLDQTSFIFSVKENTGEEREGSVTLSYPGAESRSIQIVQAGAEEDEPEPQEEDLLVEVENITSFTADVIVTPKNNGMTYVVLNGLKSEIDAMADDEEIIKYVLGVFEQVANGNGYSLEYLLANSNLLSSGKSERTMDTFVPENDYYVYAFGLGTDAVATTGVFKTPFATPAVTQYDQKIDLIEDEVETRSIQVTVKPESEDFRYLAGYFTKDEFDAAGDFIPFMIQETQIVINMNVALGISMTWESVTTVGDSVINASGLTSESDYVFWAFGVERGYANTELFTKTVTTKAVEVTDDCDFDVSILEEGSYDVSFKVVPTSPSTRYVVLVTEESGILGLDDAAVADASINSLNANSPGWYSDDNFVFSGEVSDSYDGLNPMTSYSLIVFGIDSEGERTTDVVLKPFRTGEVPQSDMRLDIEVVKSTYSDVTVNITSTSETDEYQFGIMTKRMYDSLGGNNNAVRDRILADYTAFALNAGIGSLSQQTMYLDADYDFIRPGEDYVVFAFGCSYWYATTDMFTAECSTPERNISDASVDIRITVYDGNDFVAYDPVKYPESKYGNQAVVDIQFVPNAATASWYGWMETKSAEYMNGLNYDVLLGAIKAYGTFFDSPATGRTTGLIPWEYQNICVLSLGVGADGEDGAPVIKSLYVTRDQAVEFDPSVLSVPALLSPTHTGVADPAEPETVRTHTMNIPAQPEGKFFVSGEEIRRALSRM